MLLFGQSDDSKDINELNILVDSVNSTYWLDKGFVLHQFEPDGLILKYHNTFMKCAWMWREVDKNLNRCLI